MGKPRLLFVDDSVLPVDLEVHPDALNFASDVLKDAQGKVCLEAGIRATHSGQLIAGRCYTGWGMKAGHTSWFRVEDGGSAAYNKPILVNHDASGEPLGRVVRAEFNQLKEGKDWEEDWVRPDTGLKHGSGYILLTTHVFDAGAVEKILDGRFNTVSTSQSAKTAWCSFCRTPLEKGCDHAIGSYVEGADGDDYLVYAVTGELEYWEVSFVNRPRQQNAVTLTKTLKQLRDSVDGADGDVFVQSVADGLFDSLLIRNTDGDHVDLVTGDLTGTGALTGKARVSMAKKKQKVDGAPAGPVVPVETPAPEVIVETSVVDAAVAPETPVVEAPIEVKDFAFANLAAHWQAKGFLDMEREFADSTSYGAGITENGSGHAHAFYCYHDKKTKVMEGETTMTGQGTAAEMHRHPIWMEGVESMDGCDGETRDASRGVAHTHDFCMSMGDAAQVHVTLIPTVHDVQEASKSLSDAVSKKCLSEADQKRVLDANGAPAWDAEHLAAAHRLLGRVKPDFQAQVLTELQKAGAFARQGKGVQMDSVTFEKAVKGLTDRADTLEKSLSEKDAVIAAKDAEKADLQKQLADAQASAKRFKATQMVVLQGFLSSKVVKDDELKDLVDKVIVEKDEATIDSEIATCVRDIPSRARMTAQSIVSDGKREDPVAMEDRTNQPKKGKDEAAEGPSVKSLDGLTEQADALDNDL